MSGVKVKVKKVAQGKKLAFSKFIKVDIPEPAPPPEIKLYVAEKDKPGVLACLDAIRGLFGPKGEHWIAGEEHHVLQAGKDEHPVTGKTLQKDFDQFCLIGAVYEVNGRYEHAARAAISYAIMDVQGRLKFEYDDCNESYSTADGNDPAYVADKLDDPGTITDYNDDNGWNEVKVVLKRAKELVRRA
jgi:hypothetical protein